MTNPTADHGEFVLHYESNKNDLLTFLKYRLSFNETLAEDLLMDVVVKAYENYATFDPEKGSFRGWIFTIAHNHLKNYWRSLKKQMVSLEELQEQGVDFAGDLGIDSTKSALNSISTLRVLDTLKPEEKEIITLKYINDFSNTEIAEIMNKKEGAIRTQLSRSLNRFKKHYEKIINE